MARRSKPPSNVIPISRKRKRAGPLPAPLDLALKRAKHAGEKAIDAYTETRSSFFAVRANLEAAQRYIEAAILFIESGRDKRAKRLIKTAYGFAQEAQFFRTQLRRVGRDA